EYPLAEEHLTPLDTEHWMLDTEVASYAGVARFVVGLMDDIRIVDTPALEQYLAEYVTRYWPQATKK
ncbi:MAG: transcriptional regulator, partial [Alistipes sp.]|nr:transcriptional regulator [Alistipes sp.]